MVPERIRKLDQSTDHVVAAVFLSSIKIVPETGLVVGAITATLNLSPPHDGRSSTSPHALDSW